MFLRKVKCMFEDTKKVANERTRSYRDKYRQKKWFIEEFPQENTEVREPSDTERENIRQIREILSTALRHFGIEIDKVPVTAAFYRNYIEQYLGKRVRHKNIGIDRELEDQMYPLISKLERMAHNRGEEEYQRKLENLWEIIKRQLESKFELSLEDIQELRDFITDIADEERRLRIKNT